MDLHEYVVTAIVKVPAASLEAAEEFVEGCLAQETAINPALNVVWVKAEEN